MCNIKGKENSAQTGQCTTEILLLHICFWRKTVRSCLIFFKENLQLREEYKEVFGKIAKDTSKTRKLLKYESSLSPQPEDLHTSERAS